MTKSNFYIDLGQGASGFFLYIPMGILHPYARAKVVLITYLI